MQYCSLQHWTLLLSPVTSIAGYCFCFGSIPSFFLELFLLWSPVAYWVPTDLGSSSFGMLSFCLVSKVMLKILQARHQQYITMEIPDGISWCGTAKFQMFKLVLEKAEESEVKLPASVGLSKKQESSRKTSISALLTMAKPLTVWIIINWGKFSRDRNIRPPDLAPEKSVCRSGSNS